MDKDLLREKIADTRHNEIVALIASIMGLTMVFAAYYLVTKGLWREAFTKLLLVSGAIILFIGAIVGMYCSNQRSKLMEQLESLR